MKYDKHFILSNNYRENLQLSLINILNIIIVNNHSLPAYKLYLNKYIMIFVTHLQKIKYIIHS